MPSPSFPCQATPIPPNHILLESSMLIDVVYIYMQQDPQQVLDLIWCFKSPFNSQGHVGSGLSIASSGSHTHIDSGVTLKV